jgi:DNA-binding NtrC family response regulator
MARPHLLILQLARSAAARLDSMLQPLGFEIDVTDDVLAAARRLAVGRALVLVAADPADPDAREFLVYARRKHPEVPVVVLLTMADAGRSTEASRLGADVLQFPCTAARLRDAVTRALDPARPMRDRLAAEPEGLARQDRGRAAPAALRGGQPRRDFIPTGPPGSLKAALGDPERRIILEALSALGWNRGEAARALEINRTTLYKKMKKYGLLEEVAPHGTVKGA